jgi:hypothetical protein
MCLFSYLFFIHVSVTSDDVALFVIQLFIYSWIYFLIYLFVRLFSNLLFSFFILRICLSLYLFRYLLVICDYFPGDVLQ